MFTTQRLAVRMCFTVLLIGSSPLTGQESERDAGADQLSTVLTSLHQKLGQQPAPSIDTELSALLSLEDDYRGQHVGSMAVWHLAQTATELHLVSIRQTDETGYFFTIDADRTSQNRTLARLAAGHLFQHRHLRFGKPGPNLVVTLIDGKRWNLVDHAGKLVLVQFSFKGCAPCERMYPILRELKDEHGDRLEILSIMADEKRETARDAAQTGKMTWSVCWDGSGGPIVTQWGVEQFPKVYAFGADGTVVAEGIGPEILKEFVDRWAGTSR